MEQPCQIGRKAKGEGSIATEISFDPQTWKITSKSEAKQLNA